MTRGIVPDAIDGEDRFSSLPDEMISHILSFLPTKDAVATSILSKRWRYLWTYITNLIFSDHRSKSFDNFVDRVLHHCVSKQIQRFYLCTHRAEFNQVETWINEAIRRNVQELDLSLLEFPSCVFTCKTLTVLKLNAPDINAYRKFEYKIPTSFYLPSLRILVIKGFYHSNNFTGKLFRSCPVLEDLQVMALGVGRFTSIFNISAPVLKRLKFILYVKGIYNYKFVINAPNLEYMDLYDRNRTDYKVEHLSSIAKAKVDVGFWGGTFDGEANANRAIQLIRGLSGVKSLSLSDYTVTVMDQAYQHHLPIFHNMTRLELIIYEHHGWKVLPRLLEVSPKLEVLILNKWHTSPSLRNREDASDWGEPQNLPECLSSCLELVQLEGFRGNGYELKVVEFLLVHAAGLKKLTINSVRMAPERMAPETAVKFRQKLLEFPRISRSCQVYFLGDLLSSF